MPQQRRQVTFIGLLCLCGGLGVGFPALYCLYLKSQGAVIQDLDGMERAVTLGLMLFAAAAVTWLVKRFAGAGQGLGAGKDMGPLRYFLASETRTFAGILPLSAVVLFSYCYLTQEKPTLEAAVVCFCVAGLLLFQMSYGF
jgi:hypothetical protein